MILVCGEILVDLVGDNENGNLVLSAFPGGAPFNVAVNIKQNGGGVHFVGKVGNDAMGRFLLEQTKKANFDKADVLVDDNANTTLALVTLNNGERDFSFFRKNTADYRLKLSEIDFSAYKDLSFIHVGSLMLSEREGRKLALKVFKKAKRLGLKTSFDVNFRSDVFKNLEQAKRTYLKFIRFADVVKFSEDELALLTGTSDVEKAILNFLEKDKLILVTLGSKGAFYHYNGKSKTVPSSPITPIDTTGAGDAFLGTFLAEIENKPLNEGNIEKALALANEKGAKTTQFKGAVKL